MDLQTIIENTPRIIGQTAVCAAIVYPIYSGISKVVHKEKKFTDILKEPSTKGMVAGISIGYMLLEYAKLFFSK